MHTIDGARRKASKSHRRRTARASAVGAAAIALLAGACGSTASSASKAPATTAAIETASTSGKPIQLGLINQGKGAVAFPEVANPMIAAIDYVNAHGGVGGTKIDLHVCLDDGTAGGSAACATQLVGDHVVAVMDGEDLTNASAHQVLDGAHIPMIGWNPFTADDYASTNSYWLSPGYDIFTTIVKIMRDQYHATTAGYLEPGLAAAVGPEQIMARAGDKIGLKITAVPYDYTSQDYTGPVAQLVAAHPDAIFTYAADQTASPIIQAIRQAGYSGPIFAGTTRTFVGVLGAANSKNVYVQATLYDWHIPQQAPAQDRGEIAEFLAAMKTYDAGQPETAYGQWSFSTAMDVANLFKAIGPAHVTSTSVVAALKQNVNRHNFMGNTYNCVANAQALTPGTCVAGTQIVSWSGTSWQETKHFVSAANLISG